MQATSLQAYRTDILPTLGQRQEAVLEAMQKRENWSNNELAHFLGWPINTVTPRVNELVKIGTVRKATKRECLITVKTVIAWEITPPDHQAHLFF